MVEVERAVVGVDQAVREAAVAVEVDATVLVRAAGVPREGQGAPLEVERHPLVHVQAEAGAEGAGDGDA